MRILLTHHFPLDLSPASPQTRLIAEALTRDGHEVRCLTVQNHGQNVSTPGFHVHAVMCDPIAEQANLHVELPVFGPAGRGQRAFEQLTDEELTAYRDVLREALDVEIEQFDPHIVHAQHIWVQGHLALEAGVPYVLQAWGPELAASRNDNRYRRLAQEAAENAGRILVGSNALRDEVLATFGELDSHIFAHWPENNQSSTSETLVALYGQVLTARFGANIRP
jgi:hypothetical protein